MFPEKGMCSPLQDEMRRRMGEKEKKRGIME